MDDKTYKEFVELLLKIEFEFLRTLEVIENRR